MNRTAHIIRSLRSLLTAAVLLLTIVFATSALAQLSGKGTIRGTVTDKSGAVVPGALVTARNVDTNVPTTTTTTSSGDYELSTLNPGVYTVTVTLKGFQSYSQQNIHVNATEATNVNAALNIGDTSTTVTVTEAPPAIETTNATLGATMEQNVYASLPLEMGSYGNFDQRRATDFVNLMPGVQGNETNGNSTTNVGVINGSGSRGAAAATYLSGLPFTRAAGQGDPRFIWTALPVDSVDQFQVLTTGQQALYEGQGVLNITVKSGGSKYHGSVYDVIRNTAFDAWGFFSPGLVNPYTETTPGVASTGHATKPTEHQNEYGIVLSGPVIKDKFFLFANYMGYKLLHGPAPIFETEPTTQMRAGDFTQLLSLATPYTIYDPRTTTLTGSNYSRVAFGPTDPYGASTGTNIIPTALMSTVAQNLQANLPADTINTALTNNIVAGLKYGLSNWSGTLRADYTVRPNNQLNFIWLVGRQESLGPDGHQGPAAQTTAGRNILPVPYNYNQVYAPKTAGFILQDAWSITQHLTNQFNAGYARYNGPTFNPTTTSKYSATTMGYTGLPTGQAAGSFPIVTFTDTNTPMTGWAGTNANIAIAGDYALVDNLSWVHGKHVTTVGISLQLMQYENTQYTTGTSDLTIAAAATETANFTSGSTINTKAGNAYASFLTGAPDSVSVTQNFVVETGARFLPISPYLQDTWKVTPKLTLDMGLRWDIYPPYHEQHDRLSFLQPAGTNPLTGTLGIIQYAGSAVAGDSIGTHTPVNTYYKNFGPRIGIAYAMTPKTVLRGSWGVMYTHGGGVGGGANSASGTGTLGFSGTGKVSWNNILTPTNYSTSNTLTSNPVLDLGYPLGGTASLVTNLTSTVGTGYCTTTGCLSQGQAVNYGDTELGGRAPQYLNWSFGFQHSISNSTTLTMNYVGSAGHFVQEDTANGRGQWINQLNPAFLPAGATLSSKATPATVATAVAAAGIAAPNYNAATFDPTQAVSQALKPYPQYGTISDTYGYYSNTRYSGLQTSLVRRETHGWSYMVNYTLSKSIDNGGTYRSGYDLPSSLVYNAIPGHVVNHMAIERSESTSSQHHHLVLTNVYALPFGTGKLGGGNAYVRNAVGGFKFSLTFQAFSGSPLALTASSCGTNPSNGTCLPSLNPNYTGPGRINGEWGKHVTATNVATQFIDPNAFVTTPSTAATPLYSNAPRTAPYKIFGPGNYDVDFSLRRSINLHWGAKLSLDASLFNVTNHVQFGGIGLAYGSSSFGTVSTQNNVPRQAQFEAKLEY